MRFKTVSICNFLLLNASILTKFLGIIDFRHDILLTFVDRINNRLVQLFTCHTDLAVMLSALKVHPFLFFF